MNLLAAFILPIILSVQVTVLQRQPDDPLDVFRFEDVTPGHVILYSADLRIGFSGGFNPANFIQSQPGDLVQWHFTLDPASVTEIFDLRYVNDPRAIWPGLIAGSFPAGTTEITVATSWTNPLQYHRAPEYYIFNDSRESEPRTYGPNFVQNQYATPAVPEPAPLLLAALGSLLFLKRRHHTKPTQ